MSCKLTAAPNQRWSYRGIIVVENGPPIAGACCGGICGHQTSLRSSWESDTEIALLVVRPHDVALLVVGKSSRTLLVVVRPPILVTYIFSLQLSSKSHFIWAPFSAKTHFIWAPLKGSGEKQETQSLVLG
jgi:hypothetical protein